MFHDHLDDDDEVVDRLEPFDVIVAMRERTPFPRARLERLPNLKLLVTTGMAQRVDRHRRGRASAASVVRHRRPADAHRRAHLGADPRAGPAHPRRRTRRARAGGWQHTIGRDLAGTTLGVVGLGGSGAQVAADRRRRSAWTSSPGARTSPTERAAEAGAAASSRRSCSRRSDVVTIHLRLGRAHPRPDRRRRARADEADRLPGQHLARPDRRRGRADRGAARTARSPAPASTSTTSSRCPPTTRSAALPQHRPHPAPRLRHRGDLHRVLPRRRRGRRRLPRGEPVRVIS